MSKDLLTRDTNGLGSNPGPEMPLCTSNIVLLPQWGNRMLCDLNSQIVTYLTHLVTGVG